MQCHVRNFTHIHTKYTEYLYGCHMPRALIDSLTHAFWPCIIKSFLKQKIFVLALKKVSWTDSDKILNNPPIFFIWTDSDKNVDYPTIFIFGQTPISLMDNLPRKTVYSCCAFTPNMRDVPMHVRCTTTA